MEKANQALNVGDKADRLTADDLKIMADKLKKSLESMMSAGLAKSHPLVAEATELGKSLRDRATAIEVSAVYVV